MHFFSFSLSPQFCLNVKRALDKESRSDQGWRQASSYFWASMSSIRKMGAISPSLPTSQGTLGKNKVNTDKKTLWKLSNGMKVYYDYYSHLILPPLWSLAQVCACAMPKQLYAVCLLHKAFLVISPKHSLSLLLCSSHTSFFCFL